MGIWRGQRGSGRLGRDSQSSPGFLTAWTTKLPQLSIFLILLSLAVLDRGVDGWESDVENFVSFRDVAEWAKLYKQCDPEYNYISEYQKLRPGTISFTLSPVPLPASNKALKLNKSRNDTTNRRVLYIYNSNPPNLGDYTLSYGFRKNKRCLVDDAEFSCRVMPSFGLVRGVVLNAERKSLLKVKNEFTTEGPEKFVTILNGGTPNEQKFHEAIFMGHAKGSNGSRSTHTIDGKSYPMEIYMYFVDDTLEAMSAATVLVVLVEESEEDNPNVLPLINAIKNGGLNAERDWLREHEVDIQREQMFHHMGPTLAQFPTQEKKMGMWSEMLFQIESSWVLEQQNVDYQDSFEKLLTLETRLKFWQEELQVMKEIYEERIKEMLNINELLASYDLDEYIWLLESIERLIEEDAMSKGTNPNLEDIVKPEERKTLERNEAWLALVLFHKHQKKLFRYRINRNGKENALNHTLNVRNERKVSEGLMGRVRERIIKSQFPNRKVSTERDVSISDFMQFYNHELQRQNLPLKMSALHSRINQFAQNRGYSSFEQQRAELKMIRNEYAWTTVMEVPFNHTPHPLKKLKARKTQHVLIGNMGMSEAEAKFPKLEYLRIPLKNKFQISWLIPDGGGYYSYKGSSPVPPCFQTARIIVFKKPIKMSFEQIRVLSTVPTHFDRLRNIQNTLGRLHQLRRPDFPIYFEERNHQFLGSDGVHKNSVLEAAKRRQAEGGGCGLGRTSYYFLLLILILLTLRF